MKGIKINLSEVPGHSRHTLSLSLSGAQQAPCARFISSIERWELKFEPYRFTDFFT